MHAIGKGFVGHEGKPIAIIRAVHDKLRYPARGNISREQRMPGPGQNTNPADTGQGNGTGRSPGELVVPVNPGRLFIGDHHRVAAYTRR